MVKNCNLLQSTRSTHATLHFKWDELHNKVIKYLLVLEWTPCYELHHTCCLLFSRCVHTCMRPYKSLLSLSLSFIIARAPPHARMQAWSLPFPSYARDRQQPIFVNSFNWFQLAATAFSSLSPACCLFHLPAVGLHNKFNWLRLPPVTCNHNRLLAVELCTDFNWFQLAATASNFLFTCLLLDCTLVLTSCDCFQFVSAACSTFTSGQ